MSLDVRNEIAAAATAATSLVSCDPYFRQTTSPGEACVRYGQTEFPNRFGGLATWEVVIHLPQDVAEAERFIDDAKADLQAALAPAMTVRRMYPASATYGTARTNLLVIEGTREED